MRVRFYATLRRVVGGHAVEVEDRSGLTLRELLAELTARYPALDEELFENGELMRHVHVFVNGRDAPYLPRGLDTPLKGDEKLDVFPAVGGGAAPAFEQTITGIPIWLLATYLEEMGARPTAPGALEGDGWTARLTQVEDYAIGSLRVGRVHVVLDGDDAALARVRPALEKRLVRGGG